MIKSKAYWKDIRQSFSGSKGRVISIISLMALGSFALVGLKVTAPDMRLTGANFFKEHNTADLFVIGDYGLDSYDVKILSKIENKATVEYGYFKDVVIKGENTAFRIFSKPEKLSKYSLVEGKLPDKVDEIAISAAYRDKYRLGDSISFSEKENINGDKVLKNTTFTITGFVNSSEILSRVNQGASTAGTGELEGFAVTPAEVFDSNIYMIARIAYNNLEGLSPYSDAYLRNIQEDKKELSDLFGNRSKSRFESIKADGQKLINDGGVKISDAKKELSDAKQKLLDGQEKISESEEQLTSGQKRINEARDNLKSAEDQLEVGKSQLTKAKQQLQDSRIQLDDGWNKLNNSKETLSSASGQISSTEKTLSNKKTELESAKSALDLANKTILEKDSELGQAKTLLDAKNDELVQVQNQLNLVNNQIKDGNEALIRSKANLEGLILELQNRGVDPTTDVAVITAREAIIQEESRLSQAQAEYTSKLAAYQLAKNIYNGRTHDYQEAVSRLQIAKDDLASEKLEYESGLARYDAALETLSVKKKEYESGLENYKSSHALLTGKEAEYKKAQLAYENGLSTYNEKLSKFKQGQAELNNAIATLSRKSKELADAKKTLAEKTEEYNEKSKNALKEISEKEVKLSEAKDNLDNLSPPSYNVYTRREIPGSEGYLAFENQSSIIDSVADIFPIVLYFIAGLVAFTTMGRFVDEERLKIGAFRALGYKNRDIIRKFLIYGAVCGVAGTLIGVFLGHYLMPMIVYNAYSKNIIVAPIELPFYWKPAIYALALGLIATVLPAYLVARRTLVEKPAQLLLPKPPASGSKILLERITPLWNRMSFTKKVTARNIFRYKKRMLMTIFGVTGSVAMLFTGLGVRGSIADLSTRQFSKIITYDMIVVDKDYVNPSDQVERDRLLTSKNVSQSMPVRYDKVSKVAGDNNDEQSIILLSIDNSQVSELNDYISLSQLKNGKKINISPNGAVISEKLANLLSVKVGDNITVKSQSDEDVTLTISAITEMYMNHFIFVNNEYYQEIFGKSAKPNGHLINLVNDSDNKTAQAASEFMSLSSTKGVVQNVSLKRQISTIINSLNKVMMVLVIVSILLAAVILYNLTNINVAERIRELSTIKVLGFHNKEVTMYIYRESIYLSLIGIFVGFAGGYMLYRYLIMVIPPDSVLFNPDVRFGVYIFPIVVISLTLAILGAMVNRWLRKIDMLEALKSVE